MVWVENAYIPPTARPIQQRATSWDLFRFPPKNPMLHPNVLPNTDLGLAR